MEKMNNYLKVTQNRNHIIRLKNNKRVKTTRNTYKEVSCSSDVAEHEAMLPLFKTVLVIVTYENRKMHNNSISCTSEHKQQQHGLIWQSLALSHLQ